jgi:tetratricopeptide (TPR) repeat protein
MAMTETTRLAELQRRVQRDPASISFAALAEEYRRLGQFREAIDTCRAGLQRHPSYLSARVTLGRALLEIGDYDEAAAELELVLRSAPENLAAIRALAEIHRRRGEMPEAIEHYHDAIASASVPPEAALPASEPSRAEPIAIQSTVVTVSPPPALARLEQFLAAIERARRDTLFPAAL